MAQRLWIELGKLNHEVNVVIPFSDEQLINETENYQPELKTVAKPLLTKKMSKTYRFNGKKRCLHNK